MRRIIFLLALTLVPNTAIGLSFSAPLTALVGVVDFSTSNGKNVSFDFGQRFSAIQSVSIEIEAQVFAREFNVCGTTFNPQPCVHTVQLRGFLAIMDENSPEPGFVWSDGLSFGEFDALEGSGVDVAHFNNPLVGWDFLLSGSGSLTLFWNRALGNPDRFIQNVIEPSGEIFGARLIVEGTPIPEPSTTLLLATGLLTLAVLKERSIS